MANPNPLIILFSANNILFCGYYNIIKIKNINYALNYNLACRLKSTLIYLNQSVKELNTKTA
jgi:hypothetical protein